MERHGLALNTTALVHEVNLYRAMIMLRQGQPVAARQLYSDTAKTSAPPPSVEQTAFEQPGACGASAHRLAGPARSPVAARSDARGCGTPQE